MTLLNDHIIIIELGVTSTFAGSRLPKDHVIFEALGSTDHLSSTIG